VEEDGKPRGEDESAEVYKLRRAEKSEEEEDVMREHDVERSRGK
jgi:hypothetical protein